MITRKDVEAESLQETIRIWNYMQEPVVKDCLTVKQNEKRDI